MANRPTGLMDSAVGIGVLKFNMGKETGVSFFLLIRKKTGKEATPTFFSSEEDAGSAEDRVLASKMVSSDAQEKVSLYH